MELLVIKGHQDKLSTPLKAELKKRGYHLPSQKKSQPPTMTTAQIKFGAADNLWIRVHYFSNGKRNIHVVLKPLLASVACVGRVRPTHHSPLLHPSLKLAPW
jgi:hypothetical protein